MALTKQFATEQGLDLQNAYFRIETIRGDRENFRVGLSIYVSHQARLQGKTPIAQLTYTMPTPNISNQNLFAQIYTWLKQQPDFNNAQDV